MKNFILTIVCLFSIGNIFANSALPTGTTEEIRNILESSFANIIVEKDEKVMVSFMITPQNNVIVLSTNSSNYDKTIKNILNYKILGQNDLETGTTYVLPVYLKSKK